MNNEPVAWMLADKESEYIRSIMAVQHDFVPEGCVEIPLYTHPADESFDRTASHMAGEYVSYPAKTLTDGIDLLEKYADKLEDERPNKGLSDVVYECVAILRKAQEK